MCMCGDQRDASNKLLTFALCIIKAYGLRKPAELMISVQTNAVCVNYNVDLKAWFLFTVDSKEYTTTTHEKRLNLFSRKLSKCIQIHFINSVDEVKLSALNSGKASVLLFSKQITVRNKRK